MWEVNPKLKLDEEGLTGNLVSKSLGLDNCNIVDDTLVSVEVVGQSSQGQRKLDTYLP